MSCSAASRWLPRIGDRPRHRRRDAHPADRRARAAFSRSRTACRRRAGRSTTAPWRGGSACSSLFALIVLKTDVGQPVFQTLGARHHQAARTSPTSARRSSSARSAIPQVWPQIMTGVLGPGRRPVRQHLRVQVLPTIIFIAALFAMLYYFGVMQVIVRVFAVVMRRFMRASGAESLNVAASIFMGQTEAPLTIRPFLPRMTESELMTVMTAGMAHISGGVMAAYILFGVEAQHLLTAVIMTAPGTLMMAKMFVPETGEPETMGTVQLEVEKTDVNVIDAVGRGTGEGLHLALNVGAMLISFLALIALLNAHASGHRLGPEHAADLRLGLRADRLEPRRAVARRRRPSATCSARAWC